MGRGRKYIDDVSQGGARRTSLPWAIFWLPFQGAQSFELNRVGKLLGIILARNLHVRFDKSMVKNDLSKPFVHGVVHGQSYNNS
jgi:hypothetical protein